MADTKISALGDGGSLASGDQLVIARSGADNSILAQHLPGWEIGYDQITSPVTISSTTEATPTTVITCAAHTFDGAPVYATFCCPYAITPSAGTLYIVLFESTTELGVIGQVQSPSGVLNGSITARYRFTPSAASHTYKIGSFVSASTGTVGAGAAGTGNFAPAFVSFTKA